MSILFFGGSFNPPHKGHIQAAQYACKAVDIRRVIFLVTPCNPFKDKKDLPSTEERARKLKLLTRSPWMQVSTMEKKFKLAESIKTIRILIKLYPEKKLYFAMGTDNIPHFHKWRGFEEIINSINVVFINRGGLDLHKSVRRAKFPLRKCIIVYKQTAAISSTEIRRDKLYSLW